MPVRYRLLTALAPACALICLSMPACPASPASELALRTPVVSRNLYPTSPATFRNRLDRLSQSSVADHLHMGTSVWSLTDVYGAGISGNLAASRPFQWTSAWDGSNRVDRRPILADDDQDNSPGHGHTSPGVVTIWADDDSITPNKADLDGKVSAESVLWADSAVWTDGPL